MNDEIKNSVEQVTSYLEKLKIAFSLHYHPPVYTVEEARQHWRDIKGVHCKNLFLRNKKGKRHYLVIAPITCSVDLKKLTHQLGEDRLSFASPERLNRYLGLTPGSVSPFGLLHPQAKEVQLVVEEGLRKADYVSFHPNTNTATLTLSWVDFEKFLQSLNIHPRYLRLT